MPFPELLTASLLYITDSHLGLSSQYIASRATQSQYLDGRPLRKQDGIGIGYSIHGDNCGFLLWLMIQHYQQSGRSGYLLALNASLINMTGM